MTFHSRPDLRPPSSRVTGAAAAQAAQQEGYLLLGPAGRQGAQSGTLIVDARGQPVWFRPVPSRHWISNFKVQQYKAKPVLTWWQGQVNPNGFGRGQAIIMDSTYQQVARIRAGNGRHIDLHELLLTPQGTALVTCYPSITQTDLSAVGGPRNGHVLESIIQEIDIATGRVVFEWRSLEHVPVTESYQPLGDPWDYLHVNSIDLLPDGSLLVSARGTWALYRIDRHSGRVIWRLGGKKSNFKLQKGTQFAWQHDARHLSGGRITVFDDGAGPVKTESQSRGIVLAVDHAHKTVRVAHSYHHNHPLQAIAMGNMQLLPNGNVMIGWGNVAVTSEFDANGKLLTDLLLHPGQSSYRAYRLPWSGSPATHPSLVAVTDDSSGTTVLFASWNGATAVAAWQLRAGSSPSSLQPVETVQRTGFETSMPVGTASGYAAVTALDSSGHALGQSKTIRFG